MPSQLDASHIISELSTDSYFQTHSPEDPGSKMIDGIRGALIKEFVGHEAMQQVFAEPLRALRAETLYRLWGQLEAPSEEVLTEIISGMSGEVRDKGKDAQLHLDRAYALTDLSLQTADPKKRWHAIHLALQNVGEIEGGAEFKMQPAMYRLQTSMLKNDLRQEFTRVAHTSEVHPIELGSGLPPKERIAKYRAFETDFTKNERKAIEEFDKYVSNGITDEELAFGILFEWYYVIARRHETWQQEEIDTVSVRGTTSREDNPSIVSSDGKMYYAPPSANHDVVISFYRPGRETQDERIQLKSYDYVKSQKKHYDESSVSIVDLRGVLNQPGLTNDRATAQIMKNLTQFYYDYEAYQG